MPDDAAGLLLRITYDERDNTFRRNGRRIGPEAVRREIDLLTKHVEREAARIGRRYARKTIGIAEFEAEMRELLKSAHIVAASVGRGGRVRMTAADWGKVGSRLKKEYGYLARLADKLVRGTVARPFSAYRAKLYASSIVMSYHETKRKEHTQNSRTPIKVRLIQNSKEGCSECTSDASRGWVAVEDMQEIGTRICGNFCLCEFEFSDDYERRTGRTVED